MKVVVAKESAPDERRVALIPDTVPRLQKMGMEVAVQAGAGADSFYSDDQYRQAGATVVDDAGALYDGADVVLRVVAPTLEEADRIPEGAAVISHFQPL